MSSRGQRHRPEQTYCDDEHDNRYAALGRDFNQSTHETYLSEVWTSAGSAESAASSVASGSLIIVTRESCLRLT